jgi:Flp pilus assembly protein TadB
VVVLKAAPPLAPATGTDLLRLRAAAGADLGDLAGLPARTRRAVAVAARAGAPLLDALDGALAAEADLARARRAVAVASAQTRVVAGGLVAAPLLLVPGLGRLVGADLIGFYTTPTGAAVGAVAALLLALGAGAIAGLVRRVGRPPARRRGRSSAATAVGAGLVAGLVVGPVAGLTVAVALAGWHRRTTRAPQVPAGLDEAADLTATALAGGLPAGQALRTAADELPIWATALRRLALELELATEADDPHELARLGAVLRTAAAVGAPAAPALRRLASDLRADELARVLAAAERLPAQLTFPTALCLLPATLLLVGAPIVHAGLAAAGA